MSDTKKELSAKDSSFILAAKSPARVVSDRVHKSRF